MAEDAPMPQLPIRTFPDGHEERLLRVESEVSDLKASQAELGANVKNLGEQVHNLGVTLGQKIDGFASGLVEKVQDEHQRVTTVKEKEAANGVRIDALYEEKRRQAEKWDAWKKFLGTLATGALAIGLKELVAYLLRHS